MSTEKDQIELFKTRLYQLCSQFNVLVRRCAIVRDSPRASVYTYEFELRARVREESAANVDLIE